MRNLLRTRMACFVYIGIIAFFLHLLMIPGVGYTQGPGLRHQCSSGMGSGLGNPGMGYGMGGPGMGYGMGRGLHRECGFTPGAGGPMGYGAGLGLGGRSGMGLQRGLLNQPSYCKMLLDRPDLHLTPEQREALKRLQIEHIKETFDLRSDLQINKLELRKLRFASKPDFNLIKQNLEKISKLQLELQIKRAKLQIEADNILTKEQKDSLFLSPDLGVELEWESPAVIEEEMPSEDIAK